MFLFNLIVSCRAFVLLGYVRLLDTYATRCLLKMIAEDAPQFDIIFIDADKKR